MFLFCSGDVFVGRRKKHRHPYGMHMLGHYIVKAVFQQLMKDYKINNSKTKVHLLDSYLLDFKRVNFHLTLLLTLLISGSLSESRFSLRGELKNSLGRIFCARKKQ